MFKRSLIIGIIVSILVILLGGQVVVAAPLGKAEVVLADTYVGHHSLTLELVDQGEAREIARALVGRYQVEVKSVQLVLFGSRVAWEVIMAEKATPWTGTSHRVLVDLFSGRILEHGVNKTPVLEPQGVNRDRAIAIAKGEAARPVEVKATAHMQNSRLWTINLAQRDANPAERIFLTIGEDDGRIIERGRITANGRLEVARLGPEEALTIAQGRIKSPTLLSKIGLALERNRLVWEIHLREARRPTNHRLFVDALTGRILN
ncbi:MAG: PepSY domain-containing protein [Firmicutes bacterium]|nr:PepSY domain-containing protein [Bacillota bacterium]